MKKKQYESVLRYRINGSPTVIELTPGLTSEKGPIPGAVIEFVEDGCDLFTLVLDLADLDALTNMLMDTTADQRRTYYDKPCDICGRIFQRGSIDPGFHCLDAWRCMECFISREKKASGYSAALARFTYSEEEE